SPFQYLTEIMDDERPHHVVAHASHIHMVANNSMNISPWNSVTGWRTDDVEHFTEGGRIITGMVSSPDALVVLKENTLYLLTGNLFDGWVRSRPLTDVGCIALRSPVLVGGFVFFVSRDGIYMWGGNNAVKVSKHIQSDIDGWTLTDACGIRYQNEYWVGFPTDSIVLTCDPDTVREDDAGDGRVSFFKFKTYKVQQFIYEGGSGDSGYLLAIADNGTNPYIARCDNALQDNLGTAASIDMKMQTKYV
ncbi:unnamed protein product, partial [marine sediment metagenome]